MTDYFTHHSAWVTEDGSYGYGNVIHFDYDALTETQWEILCDLNDNDKYDYVYAILNHQDTSEWED